MNNQIIKPFNFLKYGKKKKTKFDRRRGKTA